MEKKIKSYYQILQRLVRSIAVTDKKGSDLGLGAGFEEAIGLITGCAKQKKKLIFIGNGASASIASHMAADFWKNGRIRAMAFNDVVQLTCLSNDFGYKHVFEKPLEMFADNNDILIAISSSGKSENIIRAVQAAASKKCNVITLSGFSKDNPLRGLGSINFYVPWSSYGHVEVLHHSICHCMLDTIISGVKG